MTDPNEQYGPMVEDGFLNNSDTAKHLAEGHPLAPRSCRWCGEPLVHVPQGAIVCSGFCDVPDLEDPDYAGPLLPPTQESNG